MRAILRPRLLIAALALAHGAAFGGVAVLLHARGAVFQHNDPVCYYVYLRSLVHDGDVDFTNDLAMIPDGDPLPWGRDPVTGRPDNICTVGLPLLAAPVYTPLSLLLAARGSQGARDSHFPLFLDQLIFSYASFLLGTVGMWLSFRFACVYFPERDCLFATVAFWLCSPLIYYFAREPFQSHLASVFAVSLLLYIWKVPPRLSADFRAFLMGGASALLVMVRQQDVTVLLVPAGCTLLEAYKSGRPGRAIRPSVLFLLSFIGVCTVQMMVWYSLRGTPVTYSYGEQRFSNLLHPRIMEVLFSSNHGLLTWHPLIAVCLLGLVALLRAHRVFACLALAAVAAQLYVVGSWWCWWMGVSFGQRPFLSLTPLFVVGLASVVAKLTRPWLRGVFAATTAVLFFWNVVLMLAFLSEVIPYEGEFAWGGLLSSLSHLAHAVLTKIASLRGP